MNNLKQFKNIHKGKRVFLVGNGPSLNRTPLDRLVDDYSIAMNRISLIYPHTSWRPTYFICTTTNIYNPRWQKDIMTTIDMGIISFVWDKFRSLIGDRENVHYIHCTHGDEVTDKPKSSWWSDDISKAVAKFGTSMLVAMQIASYMGFDPMYLLGSDLGFVDTKQSKVKTKLAKIFPSLTGDKNHFSSSYGTPGLDADSLNINMLAAHQLAKKSIEKSGKKILNATVGGSLEVYKRVDLNDL